MKDQIRDVFTYSGAYSPEKAKVEREEKTIFEELRDSTKLPDSEKSLNRLTEEHFIILILGSETPVKAIALIVYHVMKHPDK
jgi:cytochrome P450